MRLAALIVVCVTLTLSLHYDSHTPPIDAVQPTPMGHQYIFYSSATPVSATGMADEPANPPGTNRVPIIDQQAVTVATIPAWELGGCADPTTLGYTNTGFWGAWEQPTPSKPVVRIKSYAEIMPPPANYWEYTDDQWRIWLETGKEFWPSRRDPYYYEHYTLVPW